MQKLKTFIDKIVPLGEEEWHITQQFFKAETLSKGDFFVEEGKICRKVAFIEQGLFRLFYRIEGQEKVMLFFQENQMLSDYFSFLMQSPSIRPIEAIEDAVLYTLSYQNLQKLYEQIPAWQKMGRLLAEYAYIYAVERSNRLIHDDADTRYLTLMQENPTLLQRVPQYFIASYLNMTPETLSRVKKRIHKAHPELSQSIHQPSSENPFYPSTS